MSKSKALNPKPDKPPVSPKAYTGPKSGAAYDESETDEVEDSFLGLTGFRV